MVKEDLKAKLRSKRKQAKQVKPLSPKPSQPTQTGPNLFTLIYTRKWDQCMKAATTYPKQSENKDRMGDLPLHEACNSGAPFQLIQAIHRSYPAAISHKGFCGRLPLHYASYNKPSLLVIKYLLRLYPDGASQFDDDGRLPLHLAVVRNAPKQAIQELISAYPKSLDIPNQFGNTPEMLARNDIVHDLLVAEKEKPRGIDQKLDIEKKLMKGWHEVKNATVGAVKKLSVPLPQDMALGTSPSHSMGSAITAKRGTLSKNQSSTATTATTAKTTTTTTTTSTPTNPTSTKKPLSLSDNANIPKNPTPTRRQGQTKSTSRKTIPPSYKTTTTRRYASTSMLKDDTSKKTSSRSRSTRSRSISSGRSRKTIEATHDDLIYLEDMATNNNPKYVDSSRLTSPKSPFDYHEIIRRHRTGRPKKKEIMSTSNRRKVLPSPTRQWEYPAVEKLEQPEWRRRNFTRAVV